MLCERFYGWHYLYSYVNYSQGSFPSWSSEADDRPGSKRKGKGKKTQNTQQHHPTPLSPPPFLQ